MCCCCCFFGGMGSAHAHAHTHTHSCIHMSTSTNISMHTHIYASKQTTEKLQSWQIQILIIKSFNHPIRSGKLNQFNYPPQFQNEKELNPIMCTVWVKEYSLLVKTGRANTKPLTLAKLFNSHFALKMVYSH